MKITKRARESLDRLTAEVLNGQWEDMALSAMLPADESISKLSFRNRLLVADCSAAKTYKQWKQEDGRQVRAGETARFLLRPFIVVGEDEDDIKIIGYQHYAVFDLSQTDGPAYQVTGRQQIDAFRLIEVADKIGVRVDPAPVLCSIRGAAGTYNPDEERIRIGSPDELVYWHELGHAAHYRVDLDAQDRPKNIKEIVAHLVAGAIARTFGQSTGSEYLKEYADSPAADWEKGIALAAKALDHILSQVTE